MILLRKFFLVVFGFIFFFSAITATPAEAAVQYILSITSDITNLNRGDVVTFAIDIRTKGETVTSPVVGISFDPSKIQFVSASPGDPAFSSISAQDLGGGKILFNGASPSGFTGDTTFATFGLKIIDTLPGEAEICTLFEPTLSPTPVTQPSATPVPSCVPRPANGQLVAGTNYCPVSPTPVPSCVPPPENDANRTAGVNYCPKQLPRSGDDSTIFWFGTIGLSMLVVAWGVKKSFS